jgi:DNA-binding transcriptional regulator YiaG
MTTTHRGFALKLFQTVESLPDTPVRQLALASISTDTSAIQLAAMLGVSRATVYNWFTGRTQPRPELHERISTITKEVLKKRDGLAPDQQHNNQT